MSPSPRLRLLPALGALLLILATSAAAEAHGVWGHVHVTGWAIENLPEGEVREFFSDPEVMNAALYGAAFTDSGYWPQGGELSRRSREYGEHSHWEPFIADFVAWIVENDPPPWTSVESKRVAFLMGCASHGLQDELFDSLFLYQVQRHDGGGQDEADPGTDGFLAMDRYIRFVPEPWLPMDTLLELYAGLDEDIDAEVIEDATHLLNTFYLANPESAVFLGEQYEDVIPWAREHYLDASIPGSLHAEVFPTMRYLEAIWKRLHGELTGEDVVVFTYPEEPRRLLGHDAATPDSWVTFVFGAGLRYEDTAPTWVDADAEPVALTRKNTRWGQTWPRLIRLQPDASLTPGGTYTVTLPAGPEVIDGFTMDADASLTFQVTCDAASAALCEDEPDVAVADIGEPLPEPDPEGDAGVDADVGSDADAPNLEPDVPDAEPDVPDDVSSGANGDTSVDDASSEPDAPPTDDDEPTNGASGASGGEGCGCVVSPRPAAPSWLWPAALVALAGLVWRRRS